MTPEDRLAEDVAHLREMLKAAQEEVLDLRRAAALVDMNAKASALIEVINVCAKNPEVPAIVLGRQLRESMLARLEEMRTAAREALEKVEQPGNS